MSLFIKNILIAILLLFLLTACDEYDKPSELTLPPLQSTAEAYEQLAGDSFRVWFYGTQYVYPAMALSALADENTSWYGNWGLGPFTKEPKGEFLNAAESDYYEVVNLPFSAMYDAISAVNSVLNALDNGVDFGKSPEGNDNNVRAKAFAYFVKGLSYGFLANMFDKALVENGNEQITFLSSPEVLEYSLNSLNKAIEISEKYNFIIPFEWMPSEKVMDNTRFSRLANSYAARFIAANPRTTGEFQKINWSRVEQYAASGINEDFVLMMDRDTWTDWFKYFAVLPDWMRVDYRTIGYNDTSGAYTKWLEEKPEKRDPFIIKSPDQRIAQNNFIEPGKYFTYSAPSPFNKYWGSFYWHHRYYDYYLNGGIGATALFVSEENALLLAEAEYQMGRFSAAAEIINRTRVEIGGMKPLNGSEPNLFGQLKYEMKIETLNTASGLHYFYKRGWGELMQFSPLQFPVPATKLKLYDLEPYSFGGENGDSSAPSPVAKRIVPDLSGSKKFR